MIIIPLSLGLIFILLYMAFRSFLDALVVFSNVFDLAVGGIWALYLTGTNFSISAAVGFVSLFGVAIMDGLLMISYFNALRAQGLPLHEAIIEGAEQAGAAGDDDRADGHPGSAAGGPVDQDRLADAAAAGHRGGRRHGHDAVPDRYLMPVLYSFYGHREPPAGSGDWRTDRRNQARRREREVHMKRAAECTVDPVERRSAIALLLSLGTCAPSRCC